MILKYLSHLVLIVTFMFPNTVQNAVPDSGVIYNDSTIDLQLPEVVISASRIRRGKEYKGFTLIGNVVTSNISKRLDNALEDYTGPDKGKRITSLWRAWNTTSMHGKGRAVDLAWDEELIDWLVSPEGESWMHKHGITMFIEGKPGSRNVAKYKNISPYNKYTYENRHATGDHVHIQL